MSGLTFKLLSAFMLLMAWGVSNAQTLIPIDKQNEGKNLTVEVIKSDPTEYTVKVSMHGLSDELVTNELGDFHRLSFGRDGYLSVIGEPSLPLFSQSMAIPKGATISAEITDEQWTDVEIGRIYPAQKPFLETEIARGFDFEEEAYNRNYTPTLLNIGNEKQWRNIRNTNVSVCPFRYYPQENRLSVMMQFVLKVSFAYDQRQNVCSFSNVDDPYCLFDNIPYTDASLIQVQDHSETARSANSDYYNYLIIVGNISGLNDKLTEFRRWKAQKGFKTRVVNVSSLDFLSPISIKNLISSEYNNGVRYVLLVGDSNTVPLADTDTLNCGSISGDYWYGCIRGDDIQADIPVGRFSVETSAQFDSIVNKTIKYESKYNASNRVLLVAHNEGAHDSTSFQGCCEQINTTYNEQMSFNEAYGSSSYGNNATNADVVAAINNGVHIVNYRGHGSPVLWGNNIGTEEEPVYAWNDSHEAFTINEINNMYEDTCAVFFSVACETGNIHEQTCMLEVFTRSNHGAVAFIGATGDTNHNVNNSYNKYLFNKLLNNNVYHLGDLNVSAQISSDIASNSLYNFNPLYYLCGGDPTLELWTVEPQNMIVDWTVGDGYVTLNTNLTGNYYVTVASKSGERLDSIACSSSVCTIPIPSEVNQFYITVNKHNYFPYVIYFDSVSEEIIDTTYDYDAYYSASPLNIYSFDPTVEVTVKKGHKLSIKNGSDGVSILENFKCEKGAKFEIK